MRGLLFPLVGATSVLSLSGCTAILGDFSSGTETDGGLDATAVGEGGSSGAAPSDGTAVSEGSATDGGSADTAAPPIESGTDGGTTCKIDGGCSEPDSGACGNVMTDANNCGTCGHACPSGDTCSGGFCAPTAILSGAPLGSVLSLACDSANVYWVNNVPGVTPEVYQVSLGGGSPTILSPSSPTGPAANVGVSGSTVLYTLNWGGEQTQFFTATVGGAGSGSESLVSYSDQPLTLALQGTTFYAGVNAGSGQYEIVQGTLSGTTVNTVVSSVSGTLGGTMAAVNNAAFWTDTAAGTVNFYNPTNPNMMTGLVASSESGAQSLTADTQGGYLYWVSGTSSPKLRRAPAHPAAQTVTTVETLSEPLNGAGAIASDGTNVYWSDIPSGASGVYVAPVAGGTPKLRAAAASGSTPSRLAICGTSLVWFESNGSTGVLRAAPLP